MKIAFFDFDGTITHSDTYTRFIFYATPKIRLYIGLLLVSPILLLYKLNLLSAANIRPILTNLAFGYRDKHEVLTLAKKYALTYLPSVLRDNAMKKIAWHKQQGHSVVIVSASLDIYLSFWCEQHSVKLICSELECKKGTLTGRYLHKDCAGQNKVDLIKRAIDLSLYEVIFAYGDSREDLPMLALADIKYYQGCKQD